MATTGYGLDTIKNASKSLQTLKAGMGAKRQQSRRGLHSPPGASPGSSCPSSSSAAVRIHSQTKPPLPLPLATKPSRVKNSKVKPSKSKPSEEATQSMVKPPEEAKRSTATKTKSATTAKLSMSAKPSETKPPAKPSSATTSMTTKPPSKDGQGEVKFFHTGRVTRGTVALKMGDGGRGGGVFWRSSYA